MTNDVPIEPQSFSGGVHRRRRTKKKPGVNEQTARSPNVRTSSSKSRRRRPKTESSIIRDVAAHPPLHGAGGGSA